MKNVMSALLASFLVIGSIGIAGCGGEPTGVVVPTVEASGTLLYQGKPLEFFQVTLIPEENRPAVGVSDAQGKVTFGTNAVGDGAVAGKHRATVVYVGPPNTNPEEGINQFTTAAPPKVKIDYKYTSAQTTDLFVEIPDDGTSELQIDLK